MKSLALTMHFNAASKSSGTRPWKKILSEIGKSFKYKLKVDGVGAGAGASPPGLWLHPKKVGSGSSSTTVEYYVSKLSARHPASRQICLAFLLKMFNSKFEEINKKKFQIIEKARQGKRLNIDVFRWIFLLTDTVMNAILHDSLSAFNCL